MIDPVVRPARLDDTVQLEELEGRSRSGLDGQRGGRRWLETHPARGDGWASAIAGGGVHVATIDDTVVGYLVTSREGDIARVDEVYVLPDAREVGFGDALLESAVDAARATGCTVIEGEALPGDRDLKNLYERAGITARLIIVSKPL